VLQSDPESYLSETEHAVRHLFSAIDLYESLLIGVTPPSQAQNMDQVTRYLELARKYFGYSFSESTLCGSILQIAFMGVFLFPKNTVIPAHCTDLVKRDCLKAIPFCIGRVVHGIPIGLIVYAGRNQFNHWDDKTFDPPTTQVFQALRKAYYENPFFDMAYELNYPGRTIKANYLVLNELCWRTYDQYVTDMRAMICA
jgi:hypothetical protein